MNRDVAPALRTGAAGSQDEPRCGAIRNGAGACVGIRIDSARGGV
jgi:hypothetical protein